MGGCQGKPWNYGCECRVAQIVERETQTRGDVVGRRPWSGTSLFPRRWLNDEDKSVLAKLADTEKVDDDAIFEKVEAALPLSVKKAEKEA